MWGPLMLLALLMTIHPVRVGIVLLVLSRPRPTQNLLAYWAGCAISLLLVLLIPLAALHATPAIASFAKDLIDPAPNSTSGHVAIWLGVFTLLIAALILLRSPAHQRTQTPAPRRGGRHRMPNRSGSVDTSTLVLDPNAPPVISRLLPPTEDGAKGSESAIRRLLGRAGNAWENGSVWVAFVLGFATAPSVDGAVVVLALIVASGDGIAMQFSAAIAYIIVMLAVEEVILVSSVTAPATTEAVLRRLHNWALAHRRKLLAAIFAVVGLSMVAQGMGVL